MESISVSLSSLREKTLFLKGNKYFGCKLLLVGQHTFSVNNRGYFGSLKHEVIFVWNVLGLKASSFYCMVYERCSNL